MAANADHADLVDQARHVFVDHFVNDFQALLEVVITGAHALAERPAERAVAQVRHDMVQGLHRDGAAWPGQVVEQLRRRLGPSDAPDSNSMALMSSLQARKDLSLVDDATIRREIIVSRVSLAIMDRSAWELSDLRARVMQFSDQNELADDDLFRPQMLARCLVKAWTQAGLSLETWHGLEAVINKPIGLRAEEAYHETNRWLVEHGVMPEIDLRPFIRRSDGSPTEAGSLDEVPPAPPAPPKAATPAPAPLPRPGTESPAAWRSLFTRPLAAGALGAEAVHTGIGSASSGAVTGFRGGHDDETRMLTRPVGSAPVRADVVLEQFGEIMERHLPGFRDTSQARPASHRLSEAMARAQQQFSAQVDAAAGVDGTGALTPAQALRELHERQQVLKQAATSPNERATIELVALLFQNILTDDRIPAALRVWFARLQMPTLRVAIAEPDFFSSEDHPARRLIDRMGACVMGFEGGGEVVGAALETEIKRVVQVIEAFPDTGRRVFQTVLNEFEKFLEGYYADQSDTTRTGISLAQQVEQRETLAIQYTIEMRKLLNEMPVQDGVRDFLFHVWADVLATTAVRHGGQSAEVRQVRDAASELIWTASAKTTREERAQVIRRLPPLLATLRHGMSAAGMSAQRQEESIKALNLALTAAFGARSASVTDEQLEQLKHRLETIEELIPDEDFEIDDSWVLDEASHARDGLEVVADGGSMPGPAMVEWATQLRVGDAFTLDYRGRSDLVRLAWQGMHRQLALFVTAKGRCVLFQKARLAAFLQAGLLLPAQDESLTVAATRAAIQKIEADPSRLVH